LCRACPKSFELGGLALAALLAALLAVGVTPALAVHNEGLFELGDGAATLTPGSADIVGVGGVVAPCDWTDLFDAASQMRASPIAGSVALCGGITASFLADQIAAGSATDDTTFAGGTGSDKNDHLINTWHWTTASVPAKDDVGNAYLFAVTAPANSGSILVGDLIVYAGIERISANGDSHIDIELNQAVIGLDN